VRAVKFFPRGKIEGFLLHVLGDLVVRSMDGLGNCHFLIATVPH
jgi:hypothetical protein